MQDFGGAETLTKWILVISAYFESMKRKDRPIIVCFFCACSVSGCTRILNLLVASAEC